MPSKEHEESMSAECCGGEEGPGRADFWDLRTNRQDFTMILIVFLK
jgi:hypothetical protein